LGLSSKIKYFPIKIINFRSSQIKSLPKKIIIFESS
jgi:hypothetical protein